MKLFILIVVVFLPVCYGQCAPGAALGEMKLFILIVVVFLPVCYGQCAPGAALGACFSGWCPDGHTCVNGMCCNDKQSVPSPAGNCNDLSDECARKVQLCLHPAYSSYMAQQCPKTCGKCSGNPSVPSQDCFDKSSDCATMRVNCNNSLYVSFMTQQCPRTCGRCPAAGSVPATAQSGNCADKLNPATGTSDCPRMTAYCNNDAYYTLMTDQCPLTCGRCPAGKKMFRIVAFVLVSMPFVAAQTCSTGGIGSCATTTLACPTGSQCTNIGLATQTCCPTAQVIAATTTARPCLDKLNPSTGVSDCTKMASYCNNAVYYTLMTEQCPRTCGRCSTTATTTASSTCVDLKNPATGVSDCPSRAYLCNNSVYYTLMTQQCPRTCGRCTSG